MNIKVVQIEKMTFAHVKITGWFEEIGSAYGRLMAWAGPKGLFNTASTKMLTIYHSDVDKTAPDQIEQSACLTIASGLKARAIFLASISLLKFIITTTKSTPIRSLLSIYACRLRLYICH